ncbi:hypothetical protein BDV18DRAFT_116994 [Aspergillus unguis]
MEKKENRCSKVTRRRNQIKIQDLNQNISTKLRRDDDIVSSAIRDSKVEGYRYASNTRAGGVGVIIAQVKEPSREAGDPPVELSVAGSRGLAVRALTELGDAVGLLLGGRERSGLDGCQDKELGGRSVGIHCVRLFAVEGKRYLWSEEPRTWVSKC